MICGYCRSRLIIKIIDEEEHRTCLTCKTGYIVRPTKKGRPKLYPFFMEIPEDYSDTDKTMAFTNIGVETRQAQVLADTSKSTSTPRRRGSSLLVARKKRKKTTKRKDSRYGKKPWAPK